MTASSLAGMNILIVEDEFFQARDMTSAVEREGGRVIGPTGRESDVPFLLANEQVDAALLDINLGAGPSFSTARLLSREGIPFAFLTGYDAGVIPPEHAAVPRMLKPANETSVISMLKALL